MVLLDTVDTNTSNNEKTQKQEKRQRAAQADEMIKQGRAWYLTGTAILCTKYDTGRNTFKLRHCGTLAEKHWKE